MASLLQLVVGFREAGAEILLALLALAQGLGYGLGITAPGLGGLAGGLGRGVKLVCAGAGGGGRIRCAAVAQPQPTDSQAGVAEAAGVQRPEVGLALRHAQLYAEGKRTASAMTWQRMSDYLDGGGTS